MMTGGAGGREVLRFTLNERLQHALLMVSTIVLLITGFSLLFHDLWIGRWLLWLEGGSRAVVESTGGPRWS